MTILSKSEIAEFHKRNNELVDCHYLAHLEKRFNALELRGDIVARTEIRMLKEFLRVRLGDS